MTLVRLTTELAILQKRVFGQKADRLRNDGAQQSFMDILTPLGLFKAGDAQAGERADALTSDLGNEIVEAIWVDAQAHSPLLLTAACGVVIRKKERCRQGHFQVFIAPDRHVFFAYLRENNGAAVPDLLQDFPRQAPV